MILYKNKERGPTQERRSLFSDGVNERIFVSDLFQQATSRIVMSVAEDFTRLELTRLQPNKN